VIWRRSRTLTPVERWSSLAESNWPSVDVAVLAYGEEPLLQECVTAILNSTSVKVNLFLVDNGASDAVNGLADSGELRILRPGVNTGFSGGCNIAALAGSADHIVFVNSDAVVSAQAIWALVVGLSDPEIGLTTGCIVLPRGGERPPLSSGTGEREMINAAGNPVHWLGFSWCGNYGLPRSSCSEQRDVGSVSGAFFAVRRRDWISLGGFDATYFAYHEDVDLSLRTWCSGLRVAYIPNAICVHHYMPSRNMMKSYLLERNRLITWLSVPAATTRLRMALPFAMMQLIVLANAARRGQLWDILRAWFWILRNWGHVRSRRRRVNQLRRVPDVAWTSILVSTMDPAPELGVKVPAPLNALSEWMRSIFLPTKLHRGAR
jgi:GT2 family glycosyltransferase